MGLIDSLTPQNRQKLEAIATKQRNILDIKAYEALPAKVLASYFQAKIFTAETVPKTDTEKVKILLMSDDWSAGIIRTNPLWIVHNSRHSQVRQQSNLMHEFAHLILKHEMIGYDSKTGLSQRLSKNEDEAAYLGGCLQIPRRGLLWAKQNKMTVDKIANHFDASKQMISMRANLNGISLS